MCSRVNNLKFYVLTFLAGQKLFLLNSHDFLLFKSQILKQLYKPNLFMDLAKILNLSK